MWFHTDICCHVGWQVHGMGPSNAVVYMKITDTMRCPHDLTTMSYKRSIKSLNHIRHCIIMYHFSLLYIYILLDLTYIGYTSMSSFTELIREEFLFDLYKGKWPTKYTNVYMIIVRGLLRYSKQHTSLRTLGKAGDMRSSVFNRESVIFATGVMCGFLMRTLMANR